MTGWRSPSKKLSLLFLYFNFLFNIFFTYGGLKLSQRSNSHSLFYFWGSHEYPCQASRPWDLLVMRDRIANTLTDRQIQSSYIYIYKILWTLGFIITNIPKKNISLVILVTVLMSNLKILFGSVG